MEENRNQKRKNLPFIIGLDGELLRPSYFFIDNYEMLFYRHKCLNYVFMCVYIHIDKHRYSSIGVCVYVYVYLCVYKWDPVTDRASHEFFSIDINLKFYKYNVR